MKRARVDGAGGIQLDLLPGGEPFLMVLQLGGVQPWAVCIGQVTGEVGEDALHLCGGERDGTLSFGLDGGPGLCGAAGLPAPPDR